MSPQHPPSDPGDSITGTEPVPMADGIGAYVTSDFAELWYDESQYYAQVPQKSGTQIQEPTDGVLAPVEDQPITAARGLTATFAAPTEDQSETAAQEFTNFLPATMKKQNIILDQELTDVLGATTEDQITTSDQEFTDALMAEFVNQTISPTQELSDVHPSPTEDHSSASDQEFTDALMNALENYITSPTKEFPDVHSGIENQPFTPGKELIDVHSGIQNQAVTPTNKLVNVHTTPVQDQTQGQQGTQSINDNVDKLATTEANIPLTTDTFDDFESSGLDDLFNDPEQLHQDAVEEHTQGQKLAQDMQPTEGIHDTPVPIDADVPQNTGTVDNFDSSSTNDFFHDMAQLQPFQVEKHISVQQPAHDTQPIDGNHDNPITSEADVPQLTDPVGGNDEPSSFIDNLPMLDLPYFSFEELIGTAEVTSRPPVPSVGSQEGFNATALQYIQNMEKQQRQMAEQNEHLKSLLLQKMQESAMATASANSGHEQTATKKAAKKSTPKKRGNDDNASVQDDAARKRARYGVVPNPIPPPGQVANIPQYLAGPIDHLYDKEESFAARKAQQSAHLAAEIAGGRRRVDDLFKMPFVGLAPEEKSRLLLPLMNGVHPVQAEMQELEDAREYGRMRQRLALQKAAQRGGQ